MRIQQRRERAQDAAFRLAAQTEQNKVMARKNCIDDLRNDGIFITHDAREKSDRLPATV